MLYQLSYAPVFDITMTNKMSIFLYINACINAASILSYRPAASAPLPHPRSNALSALGH
jgi:hypothetical protein